MEQIGSSAQPAEAEQTEQFLLFQVEKELFGVPILKIQEIIGYRDVTPIPNTPKFLRGVINLRGIVAPVVDLRRQFGFADREYDRFNVIVIIHAYGKIMGVIVDSVRDVVGFSKSAIQPRPEFSSRINTAFISGVVSRESEMTVLLDLDRVLTDEQMGILDQAAQEAHGRNN